MEVEAGPGERAAPPSQPEARALTWWRRRRVDLRPLPTVARRLALTALTTTGAMAALLVAVGLGWKPPLGRQPVVQYASLPRLAVVFCYVGLAVSSAVICAAAAWPGWHLHRLTYAAVATVGAGLAAGTIVSTAFIEGGPGVHPFVARSIGWIGMAGAAALALLPDRAVGERRWLRPALAASPFAAGLLAYAVTTGSPVHLGGFTFLPRDGIAQSIETVTGGLGVGLAVLVLWGTMQSARLGRDVAYGAIASLRRMRGVVGSILVVALAVKVLFELLGYAGALPHVMNLPASFDDSRHNGPVAWLLAAALAAGAAWWLLRTPKEPMEEEGFTTPAWLVVVGFTGVILAATVLLMGVFIALLYPSTGPAKALSKAVSWLLSTRPPLWGVVATVVGAAVAGVLLLRVPRHRAAAMFLLAVGAWCLPRAFTLSAQLLTEHLPFSSVTLVTIDAALTVAVAVLAVLWASGRQRAAGPDVLLFVLLVSTLVARPGFLPTGWKVGALFYLALVFPVAYQFLFAAGGLNRPGPDRPTRVLGQAGLACALLTIALLQVAAGLARPQGIDPLTQVIKDLGRLYLLIPFGAFLVVSAVTAWDRPASEAAAEDAEAEPADADADAGDAPPEPTEG